MVRNTLKSIAHILFYFFCFLQEKHFLLVLFNLLTYDLETGLLSEN